ncbi:hypothetical protein PO909_011398 [Leuciscus waleckii]
MSDPVSEELRTVERDHGFPKPFRTVHQGHYECDAEAARWNRSIFGLSGVVCPYLLTDGCYSVLAVDRGKSIKMTN